jgi:hypothetical protein
MTDQELLDHLEAIRQRDQERNEKNADPSWKRLQHPLAVLPASAPKLFGAEPKCPTCRDTAYVIGDHEGYGVARRCKDCKERVDAEHIEIAKREGAVLQSMIDTDGL